MLVLGVAALLGFLIGWLLMGKAKVNKLETDLDACRGKCGDLESKLSANANVGTGAGIAAGLENDLNAKDQKDYKQI